MQATDPYTESYESTLAKSQVRQAKPLAEKLLLQAQVKRQAAFNDREWNAYWFWFDYCQDAAALCGILNAKPL